MTKRAAKGTVLQLEIATVYTAVSHVGVINGPDAEVQVFDATTLDSDVSMDDGEPTGHTAPGSVSGDGFYDPALAIHEALTDLLAAPAKVDWKIVYPSTLGEIAFTGVLINMTPNANTNEGIKFDYNVKLSSLATYPTAA